MQWIIPKYQEICTKTHGVTPQETANFLVTAAVTLNLSRKFNFCFNYSWT